MDVDIVAVVDFLRQCVFQPCYFVFKTINSNKLSPSSLTFFKYSLTPNNKQCEIYYTKKKKNKFYHFRASKTSTQPYNKHQSDNTKLSR